MNANTGCKEVGLQLCKGGGEGEDGGLDLDKAARSSHTTPTHCGCTHVCAFELLDPSSSVEFVVYSNVLILL